MTKGVKIALGCGCLVLLAGAAIVIVLGVGAFWAKSKLEEATGGLDGFTAKTQQIADLEQKVRAVPYTPPRDGVIAEARLVTFLESRKRVFPLYEQYRDDLSALESKGKGEGRPSSVSELVKAGGRVAAAFTEVRLAQLQALADLGMNEQEYRDIQMAVAETAWAAESQTQSGRLPAEADTHGGAAAASRQERAPREPVSELGEAAKTLEVPKANAELFRKYSADIKKYAMTGLGLIGM